MALSRLFSTRKKLSKDASGRPKSKPTTAAPSGILSKPFPPLSSRAKSPSDVLDFVGYPRLSHSTPISQVRKRQSTPQLQPQRHFTIRNQTPQPDAEQPQLISHHTPPQPLQPLQPLPPLKMPTPRRVIPPTRHMLSAELTDKTLVEEPESIYPQKESRRSLLTAPFNPNVVINRPLSIDHTYPLTNMSLKPRPHDNLVENYTWCPENGMHDNDLQEEITALQERIHEFNREKSEWAKRETEHRQNEQRMLETIHHTQVQLEKLSLATLNAQNQAAPLWQHSPRRRKPSVGMLTSSSAPSLRRSRSHSTTSRSNSYTRDEESESSETNEHSGYDDGYYDYNYNDDSYEDLTPCEPDIRRSSYVYSYPVAPSHHTPQSIRWPSPHNNVQRSYPVSRRPLSSADTRGWLPKEIGGRNVFQNVYDRDIDILDDYEPDGSGVPWSSSCPQPSTRGYARYPRHPTPRVYNETSSFGQRYSTDPCRTAPSSYRSQPTESHSTVRRSISSSSGSQRAQRAPPSPHDYTHWIRRL
ncbi:hypothetical protein PHYBLDRAFT_162299 [Phycomyces blakesleeanus NRRL 1555(-)]|uniref:Uncharacterized protein n=1 Tax=Phycomyces blakesleeanus (strain ATCC 8743b / DSM 1359 / FGSC 10004 / NBRC 33097 / NRRL 1555) TaxID=763407 RepID=A0A163BAD7_PHYB8|nr:hypothetical protein PHYBLDRAFT_162299 [Phycomyces blakesleeanus NRRL 1555(-)]OAD79221.1 hypothetical protein PHYBLDRAFT_162299 [Phycomyces blakesleeanus NRRL 1555(-)]|eukprot:XP_018297261.1 hypothetical protein PHYBLDRAFT_162299 [Phycomyces blakesleeanus NRRL 1555(-)]